MFQPRRLLRNAYSLNAAFTALGSLWAVCVAAQFGEHYWLFEVFSHFPLHYCLLAFALTLFFTYTDHLKLAPLAAILCCWQGWIVFSPPALPLATKGDDITFISYNVAHDNRERGAIMDWLEAMRPTTDFVVLVEVSFKWDEEIEILKKRWPYVEQDTRFFGNGIVVLSKHKLEDIRHWTPSSVDNPVLIARTQTAHGTPYMLYAIHPFSPRNDLRCTHRANVFSKVADDIALQKLPSLVVGDYNSTQHSAVFQKFIIRAGLTDMQRDLPFLFTWPTWAPIGITIDRVAATSQFSRLSIITGPNLGSDHLPIISHLKLDGATPTLKEANSLK